MTICLTPDELFEVTGYRRAHEQLEYFRALGVPAHRRPDNTVSVVRQHLLDLQRRADAPSPPRPRLRSDETTPETRLRKARLSVVR